MLSNEEVQKKIGAIIPVLIHALDEEGTGWVLIFNFDIRSAYNHYRVFIFDKWKQMTKSACPINLFSLNEENHIIAIDIAKIIYKYGH